MSTRPTALVTGASSGIGLAFARHLARIGHDLVVVARRADRLNALADELGGDHGVAVEVIVADLADAAGMTAICSRIAAGSRIDILVNNAGFAARGAVATLDGRAFDAMLAVNVTALARLSQAAFARMLAAGSGTIINVSSGTIFMEMPGNAGYGASKSFVAAFTRTMQAEAAGTGVRIQLLVPGLVATEFHAVSGSDSSRFPPGRIMQADDLVVASLRGLERGEAVCIPSLPDAGDWDSFAAAQAQLAANVSFDRPAARYR